MSMSMNNNCNVANGTVIRGKWHQNSYRVISLLGSGANGKVYLAESKQGQVAIKLSENSMGITSEVNVLKRLAEAQGSALGPSLMDVDDYFHPVIKKNLPFYVMEYIKGDHFIKFIERRGTEWIDILILQLLSKLDHLHRIGWVFGDLKPDNLIVTSSPFQIRCIDVGGTTRIGRSIKEYTEFFDRGFWEMGTRKAEPSYDLFAVAMIMYNAVYPKRFKKNGTGKNQLLNMIDQHPYLRQRKTIITKALFGSYSSAANMKEDLIKLLLSTNRSSKSPKSTSNSSKIKGNKVGTKIPSRSSNRKVMKKRKRSGVFETFFILICIALLYSLYIFTNIF